MEKIKPLLGRLQFIDQKLREKKYPNCVQMAKEYEVADRTIHRDIEYMRTMLDAPIAYDKKRRGFYYTEENYVFQGIRIKESDLFAICIAEKALALYANTPLYDKLSAVFEKIRSFLPDSVTVRSGLLDDRFTFLQESATRISEEIWDTVAEGLRTGKKVEIVHRKAGGGRAHHAKGLPLPHPELPGRVVPGGPLQHEGQRGPLRPVAHPERPDHERKLQCPRGFRDRRFPGRPFRNNDRGRGIPRPDTVFPRAGALR